jgi:hypothetical protein
MKIFLFVIALTLSNARLASAVKPHFFGGVGSTQRGTSSCYPNMETFGYPAANSVKSVVAAINASPNEPVTLVGHSSGASYVNQIASQVKNPGRITLVSLDGFTPKGVPKSVNRTCWKATNGHGTWSKNAQYMTTANGCGTVKTFTLPHCETAWCLHFALVNLNAPKDLSAKNFIQHGYDNCKPNRNWLRGEKAPVSKATEETAVQAKPAPLPGAPKPEIAPALKPAPYRGDCALGDTACERLIYVERIKRALGCFSKGEEAAKCPLRVNPWDKSDESRISAERRAKPPAGQAASPEATKAPSASNAK